jgi:hypothetical protein
MTGPTMSLGQAVTHTGVSTSTLRRRLAAGEITGAERLPSGGWSIPVAGLIAAGLTPRQTPPDSPTPVASTTPAADVEAMTAEVTRLRAEVTRLEAVAAERAERITDLRLALEGMTRALPPVTPTPATPPGQSFTPADVNAEPSPVAPVAPRRPSPAEAVRRWRARRRP